MALTSQESATIPSLTRLLLSILPLVVLYYSSSLHPVFSSYPDPWHDDFPEPGLELDDPGWPIT